MAAHDREKPALKGLGVQMAPVTTKRVRERERERDPQDCKALREGSKGHM